MYILAIDPGNEKSAYVMLDPELKPLDFEIVENIELLDRIYGGWFSTADAVAIEMIASYGMSVGATVFETCLWIGRFHEAIRMKECIEPQRVYRKDEKINLCGSMKAKDTNIRQALIDRFGEVGTKKNKGWFYGVSKDIWSAIAVGVTYHDLNMKNNKN